MESKEYFEKVMQDYNQNRRGRSLRKFCKDEAVDYDWIMEFKKNYPANCSSESQTQQSAFIPLSITEEKPEHTSWSVDQLILKSPDGNTLEIKSSSLFVVAELLHKMS